MISPDLTGFNFPWSPGGNGWEDTVKDAKGFTRASFNLGGQALDEHMAQVVADAANEWARQQPEDHPSLPGLELEVGP